MPGQGSEGDGPAGRVHLGDAVLPAVPGLAAQMIRRPRRQGGGRAVEPARPATAEAHDRRRAERHADDVLENRAVAVPADSRARVVAGEQHLRERLRREPRERRAARPERQQPIGDRSRRRDLRGVEIVVPAERGGDPLAEPALEAERRERHLRHPRDEFRRRLRRDDAFRLGEAGQQRPGEKVGLRADLARCCPSRGQREEPLPPGADPYCPPLPAGADPYCPP